MPTLIRQIDHVLIASQEAKDLFALFTETFQLPVVWPMSDYGGFVSGGLALGNVNLEVLKATPEFAAGTSGARYMGFALEPEPLRTSLPALKTQGVRYDTPVPFRSVQPSGSTTTLWTTVGLPDLSSEGTLIFLCEYEHDVAAQRRRSCEQLRAQEGGPLSIDSVREIVHGVVDLPRTQQHWQQLLQPLQATREGSWSLGAGPAIRLVQAECDGIQELVLNVKSLREARRFLEEQSLLGAEDAGALTLAGARLQGLSITLMEHSG